MTARAISSALMAAYRKGLNGGVMLNHEASAIAADLAHAATTAPQCCMCGKTGLSIAEDGGPECELRDGRWVCSGECWDIAAWLQARGPELVEELR